MTYNELCRKLNEIGVIEYENEAKILAFEYSKIKASELILNKNIELDNEEKYKEAIEKRKKNIPIQYIVGKTFFYNQEYKVNEYVLIPRQDTEILVERAIELLPKNARFIDLCTGSGCIAISTLCERKDTMALAVDKFQKTLLVAEENAELNSVLNRLELLEWDILDGVTRSGLGEFDAIISNPPYIKKKDLDLLSNEVKKEPMCALDGGIDGMCFYRKIVKEHSALLKKDGFILFEIGYDEANDIKEIAKENGFSCEIIKDYGGNDRVAILRKMKGKI